MIMSYPKVLALGSLKTERTFIGSVYVEEKCDGSQFRFGVDHGEVVIGSHHSQLYADNQDKSFKPAMDYIKSISGRILEYPDQTYFFCEYLSKPKHNHIAYLKTPHNMLMLFDCFMESKWVGYEFLQEVAANLDIGIAPLFFDGFTNLDDTLELLKTESYLGGSQVEGVVIKNYNEVFPECGVERPVFSKLVNAQFKEVKSVDDKKGKQSLNDFLFAFRTEARWNKAVQSMREAGILQVSPRDIGPLLDVVRKDIVEEETDNIKEWLYRYYIKQIQQFAISGMPQWYKDELLKNVETPDVKPE